MSAKRRVRMLNLRDAEISDDAEIYTDRFVVTLRGNYDTTGFRHVVRVHLAWRNLPWLMRKIWAAWWEHKKDTLRHLAWVEKELGGGGVRSDPITPIPFSVCAKFSCTTKRKVAAKWSIVL